MKTNERGVDKRGRALRVAQERRELLRAYRGSGQSQAAFCRAHGLNATTFNGWLRRAKAGGPAFVQVEVARQVVAEADAVAAAVEVLLPNGARIGIRHQGRRDELVALVRGVAGYREATPC